MPTGILNTHYPVGSALGLVVMTALAVFGADQADAGALTDEQARTAA